jgi:hypothetical protein
LRKGRFCEGNEARHSLKENSEVDGTEASLFELDEWVERAEASLGLRMAASAPLEGLERVLQSYAHGPQADLADLVFNAAVERALKNLITTEHLASQLAGLELSPTIIALVGLPRTGSTLLHNMLALGEDVTAVSHLDAINPTWRSGVISQDEAAMDVYARLELMDAMSPGIRDRHPVKPGWPDECTLLLANSGGSYQWPIMFELPDHLAWLHDADLTADYDAYRRALAVVTDGSAGVLVLKSPFHGVHLDQLRRVMPQVKVVATVRSSQEIVPSWFGLLDATQAPLYGTARTSEAYAARWVASLEHIAIGLVEASQAGLIDQVISYEDLIADPVGVAGDLLDGATGHCSGGLAQRAAGWLGHPEAKRTGPPASWCDRIVTSDMPGLDAYDRCFGLRPAGEARS